MSKDITVDGEYLILKFNDEVSAFNGLKKAVIQGKGDLDNQISAHIFKYLHQNKIPTHFIETLSSNTQRVEKVEMFPLEIIVRNKAAGPWMESLGFKEGDLLNQTIIEYHLKSVKLQDPIINATHILAMKLCTYEEIELIRALSLTINELLNDYFLEHGIDLIDIKLEFGVNQHNEIVVADSITPDTLRIWDYQTKEPLDKDVFRKDVGKLEVAYQKVLDRLEGTDEWCNRSL